MSEIQIKNEIEKLKSLSSNGIDSDELDEAKSILEIIKSGKASKEQLEEIIKLLDNEVRIFHSGNFVAVNVLNGQKEDFEKLLSNYNTEKQVIVDESVDGTQNIKGDIVVPLAQNGENQEAILNKYNEKYIQTYSKRITNVISKLDEVDETQKKLKEALEKLLKNPSNSQVELIQNIIISLGGKVSKSGSADSFFGPKTMSSLEKIIGIKVIYENINSSATKNNKPSAPSTKRSANISVLKTNNENIGVNKVVVGYSKNGANYIIGVDGKEKLITYETLSPEYKKILEKNKDLLLRIENFNLIAEAAKQNGNPNLVNGLNKRLANLNIKTLGEMDSYIQANAAGVNLKNKASVLNYIRDKIGNNSFVLNELSNELFYKNTKISEKEIQDFINNPSLEHKKIKSLVKGEYKELVDDVIDKKAEAEKYFAEYKPSLQKQYPKLKPEQLRELVISSFLNGFTKTKILEIQFEGFKNIDKSKTPLAYLFSDITGAGTLKDSSINVSDSNKMWGKEALILIATEAAAILAGAVTIGVGAYAVNAAVYGTRGYKGIKSLQIGAESGKIAKATNWGAMSIVEGSSFYAGYAGAQSGLEGKNMYSRKGLGESIAFAGAFRGLNGIYKLAKIDLKPNIPLHQQKIKLTSQLLADTTAFAALGLGFEGKLLEPGEWTAETILQAFMMAAVFKGAGIAMEKIKLRKNGEKVEAVKEEKNGGNENIPKYKWSTETPIDKDAKPLINGLKPGTKKTKENFKTEDISDAEYDIYLKDPNKIPDSVIESIVYKTINGKKLTEKEIIINSWKEVGVRREKLFKEIQELTDLDNILMLLKYENGSIDGLKSYNGGVAIEYAKELQTLLRTKGGKDILNSKVSEIRKTYQELLNKLNINDSAYGKQDTWIYWDIAKQLHLSKNPSKSDPSKYSLGNPLTDNKISQDIIDRHLGWEIAQKEGIKLQSSHEFTKLGRERREGLKEAKGDETKEAKTEEEVKKDLEEKYGKEKTSKMMEKLLSTLGGIKKVKKYFPAALEKDIDNGIQQFLKDIFLSKWNLVGALAGAGLDQFLLDDYVDGVDRMELFLKSLFIGYLAGTAFNIAGKGLKYTLSGTGSIGRFIWNNKGKLILGGIGAYIACERTNYNSFSEMFTDWLRKEKENPTPTYTEEIEFTPEG